MGYSVKENKRNMQWLLIIMLIMERTFFRTILIPFVTYLRNCVSSLNRFGLAKLERHIVVNFLLQSLIIQRQYSYAQTCTHIHFVEIHRMR